MEYEDVFSELVSSGMVVYVIDPLSIDMEAGEPQAENVVMVGAFRVLPGSPVGKDAVRSSIRDSVTLKAVEANLVSFEKGYEPL